MYDTDQERAEGESDRAIHWIELVCAAAWVRAL
jgi:hypothetical protein